MSLRPAWSTQQVPGEPGLLHRETLFQNTKKKRKEKERIVIERIRERPCAAVPMQAPVTV